MTQGKSPLVISEMGRSALCHRFVEHGEREIGHAFEHGH